MVVRKPYDELLVDVRSFCKVYGAPLKLTTHGVKRFTGKLQKEAMVFLSCTSCVNAELADSMHDWLTIDDTTVYLDVLLVAMDLVAHVHVFCFVLKFVP